MKIKKNIPNAKPFIITLVTVILSITSLWGVLEIARNNLQKFLAIIISSIIVVIFYYWKLNKVKKQTRLENFKLEQDGLLKDIKDVLSKIKKENHENIFKYKLITSRLKKELQRYEDVKEGKLELISYAKYEYFKQIFYNTLDTLVAGDYYHTLSTIDFWYARNFESEKDFLDLNIRKVKRGVKIKRIIILDLKTIRKYWDKDDKLIYLDKIKNIKDEDKDYIKKVREVAEHFLSIKKSRKLSSNRMPLSFYLSNDYVNETKSPVPFALIHDAKSESYISALADKLTSQNNDNFPRITILFHEGNDNKYNQYQSIFDDIEKKLSEFGLHDFFQLIGLDPNSKNYIETFNL